MVGASVAAEAILHVASERSACAISSPDSNHHKSKDFVIISYPEWDDDEWCGVGGGYM